MTGYLEFVLITSYMVITYNIIALKYRRSIGFSAFSSASKVFLVAIHVFIVMSNILLYFWLIYRDFSSVHAIFMASGLLMLGAGSLFIFWGIHSLRKAVFVPESRLIESGPFALVRHPMYFGGIIGALGIAIFSGSLLGLLYSLILSIVLSHIADAEEEDLKARFGRDYEDYKRKVPKIFPNPRHSA